MIDLVRRHVFRVLRNFSALVLFFMTADFLVGPVYYLIGMIQNGFYMLASWQIQMIFTAPIRDIHEYAMLALMVQFFWEIFRVPFVLFKVVRNYSANRTGKYSTN